MSAPIDSPRSDDSLLHPVFAPNMLWGLHLLEADAGTGKTWTLTGLIVRAIIERNAPIDSILAVTFTNAAVAELKTRTRARLLDMAATLARATLLGQASAADPFTAIYTARIVAGLISDSDGQKIDCEAALRRIQLALARSDELAAFTLHGFCQRLLSSQPLLTRTPPELNPVADGFAAIANATRDWWRSEVLSLPLVDASLLLALGLRLTNLIDAVAQRLMDPLTLVLATTRNWRSDLKTSVAARSALAESVSADQAQVMEWFGAGKAGRARIDGRNFPRKSTLKHLASLLEFSRAERLIAWPADALEYFSSARFVKHAANLELLGQLRLVRACDQLLKQFDERLNAIFASLVSECLDHVHARLDLNRFNQAELPYDELVRLTYEALHDPSNGARLAAGVRQRYGFALVDECQDTDSLQWSILRNIWPMNSPQESRASEGLVLVGDPKQSIYRFRGADIYAYLEARSYWSTREGSAVGEVVRPELARLDENQRSDPPLLEAINAIFGTSESFLIPQIEYLPSRPGTRPRAAFKTVPPDKTMQPGKTVPPLETAPPLEAAQPLNAIGQTSERGAFCWVQWTLPEKADTQTIAQACANEILSLLAAGRTSLDGKPLAPNDIAVLVSRHDEGRAVKSALKALGLGAVEITREQVTSSAQAYELLRVVAAVASPGETRLLRGALATRALGVALAELDDRLIEHAVLFEEARLLWPIQGPRAALNLLLRHFDTPARLANDPQAERALTNHSHMLDLLAGSAQAQSGAASGLRWLQRVIDQEERPDVESDQLELRLESDANLIRILTLHKSKGLEFPVVFVPFAWQARRRNQSATGVRFHRYSDAHWQAMIDLNFQHQNTSIALQQEEELAERLRLLYVALTRARHRCYLFGPPLQASAANISLNQSAIEYLLSRYSAEHLQTGMAAITRLDITDLLASDAAALLAPPTAAPTLRLAHLQRRLLRDWQTSSYSGILASARDTPPNESYAVRDRDQSVISDTPQEPASTLRFGFPAGANAGACLHRILEETDFQKGVDAQRASRTLASYGLQGQSVPEVVNWLNQVLDQELILPGLRLNRIAPTDRLVELEFSLRVTGLGNPDLVAAIARTEPIELDLPAHRWRGFLNGFIDLVFRFEGRYYVLDWKSNWLGNSWSNYDSNSLRSAIRQHSYALQYSIYQLALHRHLQLRLHYYDPRKHLGGVFYLFLRGVGAAPLAPAAAQAGIYFRAPEWALLQTLDRLVLDGP